MNHKSRKVASRRWVRQLPAAFLLIIGSGNSFGASNVEVYVAYAENVHLPQVFMPNPWYGSARTIFLGYPGSPPAAGSPLAWNTGAILIRNAGKKDVVLGPGVTVDGFADPTISFKLWDSTSNGAGDGLLGSSGIGASGLTIHPEEQVIFAQTGASRNSGTDFSFSPCSPAAPAPLCLSNFNTSATPAGEAGAASLPVIHLVLDGVSETFIDSAQVLNTAGSNPGSLGPSVTNQSVQWRLIGTTGSYLPGGSGVTPPAIATWHNDNLRTGLNARETTLNLQDVNCSSQNASCSFGKLFVYPVDGAVYSQPLFVPNVLINGAKHNTVFVTTSNNSVYAFDAESAVPVDNGQPLWMTPFGAPPSGGFQVLSTPVIDTATNTLYVITNNNGDFATLHALDVRTGHEKPNSPTNIGGSVLGGGDDAVSVPGSGQAITFNVNNSFNVLGETYSSNLLQRPALLLDKDTVYVAFGSGGDFPPYHGWLFGYDASNISRPTEIFNSTPMANSVLDTTYNGGWNLAGGSFWMIGAGPAADAAGIFATTANGMFDHMGDYGDSVVRLIPRRSRVHPPRPSQPLRPMRVADYFTPFDQKWLACNDSDLGTTGPMLIPDSKRPLLVQASKSGRLYLLDRTSLGKHHASCSPPGGPPCEPIVQVIDQAIGIPQTGTPTQDTTPWCSSTTGPGTPPWAGVAKGSPAYFNGAVYYKGDADAVKAFSLVGGQLSTTPLQSANIGDPSATPSISYDSSTPNSQALTGIVWTVEQNPGQTAVLHAYAAQTLQEIYNSSTSRPTDAAGMTIDFPAPPTVAAGKVFIATLPTSGTSSGSQGQLLAYGSALTFPLQTTSLAVTLRVFPPSYRGRFDVRVDGTSQLRGVRNNASTGPLQMTPGAHVVSTKLVSATYGLNSHLSISYGGSCAAGGGVTLQLGTPANCTIDVRATTCPAGEFWDSTNEACHSPCPVGCPFGCLAHVTPPGPPAEPVRWVCKASPTAP